MKRCMPARSKLSRYWTLYRLALQQLLGQGFWFIFTWVLTTVVIAAVTMAVYVAAYQVSPQSLPLSAAVWSLAIATFLRLTWRRLTGTIAADVRSGDIALRIRYPFPYFGSEWAEHAGVSLPTAVPFLCLSAYLLAGFPIINSPEVAIPIFILMMIGSFALSTMMYTLMGLFAFWMEDPFPLLRIVEKVAVVLGGSVVPLALLPGAARHIIEFVPLAAAGFPALVTSPDFIAHAPRLLAIEFGWVLVIGATLMLVWKRAQRRIEVNGG